MKLYDFPFSPNCRKVRAVAYELGLSFATYRRLLARAVEEVSELLWALETIGG